MTSSLDTVCPLRKQEQDSKGTGGWTKLKMSIELACKIGILSIRQTVTLMLVEVVVHSPQHRRDRRAHVFSGVIKDLLRILLLLCTALQDDRWR